jgi:hypothetical protein
LASGGFFFGTQRFDFSLSLIDRASALYRIGSSLGFDAAGRDKRCPVGEVAALARAKQRYPLHAAVEQPTDALERSQLSAAAILSTCLSRAAGRRTPTIGARPVRGRPRFRRRFFIEFWLTKNSPLATRKRAAFAKMQRAFLVALVAQHLGERGVELDQRNRSPARTRWRWRAWRWRRPSNAKVGAQNTATVPRI